MTIFTAHQKVDTSSLKELLIANPLNATLNDLYHDVVYGVGSTSLDLHSGDDSLLFTPNEVYEGNITSLSVTKNGDPAYSASGFLFKLSDLFNDINDNNTLDSIPAQIFGDVDVINGSPFNDWLFGFAGDDVIRGNKGNDIIDGGDGQDTLSGGPGKDVFIFDQFLVPGQADTIKDFQHGSDKIELLPIDFPGVHATSNGIAGRNFHIGAHPGDQNDFITYNPKNGALFYDQDGSGSTYHQIKFAVLTHAPSIDAHDFVLGL